MLDQKVWIRVQFTPLSEQLDRIGNHTSCVMTNHFNFEKTIIFGGMTHRKYSDQEDEQAVTHLSNYLYAIEVR